MSDGSDSSAHKLACESRLDYLPADRGINRPEQPPDSVQQPPDDGDFARPGVTYGSKGRPPVDKAVRLHPGCACLWHKLKAYQEESS